MTRAPANGFCAAYLRRTAINPGISFSAISISFLPQSANDMSATRKGIDSSKNILLIFLNIFINDRDFHYKLKIHGAINSNPTKTEPEIGK